MIGVTNITAKERKVLIDEHALLYINGKSLHDQSIYKADCTLRHGSVYLTNVKGPYNNELCPVIWLNSSSIGYTSTNTKVNRVLSQTDGWTWEFWRWRIGVVSSEDCFSVGGYTNTSANALHCDTTDGYYSKLWRNNAAWSSSTAAPFSTAAWYHVAYVIYDNVVHLYLNGILKATYNNIGNTNTAQGVMFGGYSASGWAGTGINSYIAEARLSDIPRYLEEFTPPTRFLY